MKSLSIAHVSVPFFDYCFSYSSHTMCYIERFKWQLC